MIRFAEAAARVGLHAEWLDHGFDDCVFERRALGAEEAVALRTCWPPCARFDSGAVLHDGDDAPIDPSAAPPASLEIMVCAKSVLDAGWPEKYRAIPLPGGDLVAIDGNHRLAALALRRAAGRRDAVAVDAWVCDVPPASARAPDEARSGRGR